MSSRSVNVVKSIFNFILGLVIAGILYFCFTTIMVTVRFNKAKEVRDKVVENSLILLRNTQLEYSKMHQGQYCSSWTELIAFAKSAKLARATKNVVKNTIDTTWVDLADSLYPQKFNIDSIKYVPYGRGVTFEITSKTIDVSKDVKIHLLQIQTPYNVYLLGLDREKVNELEDFQTGKSRYPGLRIGDLEKPNGLAGNWESNSKQ